MEFFEIMVPILYWTLTVLCLVIMLLCLKKFRRFKVVGAAVMVIIAIVFIDALEVLSESQFFSSEFNSLYKLIPESVVILFATPAFLIIPKLVNVIAGLIITYLLVKRWQPKVTEEVKQADERQKLASRVFSSANEGIAITDIKGAIIDVNEAFIEITGYSREELIGKNPRILNSGLQSPEFYKNMWEALKNNGIWKGEIWNKRKNGEIYAEMLTISSVHNTSGKLQNYVALFSDITMLKEHQKELEYIAYNDALTNLPNRKFLAEHLTRAMMQCQQKSGSLAVIFLDLDGFKAINDCHGHSAGDELLITISRRMKEALRSVDMLARIGGDEFVAVVEDLSNLDDCERALKRLLTAASQPMVLGGAELQVSASIGVTIYPQDGADADQLMRHADQAMYLAKQKGKNRYQFFDTVKDTELKTQHKCVQRISVALDNRELVLFYQPKVNLRTGQVIGVEALLRWQHPERGLLAPNEFLPLIENHPISIEIGEWVIDSALKQIKDWQTSDVLLPISVNVSAFQLQQSNFTKRLSSLLATHADVKPNLLQLEVLETSALDDLIKVSTLMRTCGVSFAIDDFGTGYCSLTYLRHLPAHLIKIDQSFIRGMLSNPGDLAIVESVVGLAHSFKCDVIAEGVESIEHGVALLKLGCELAQGYAIARPMEAEWIPEWVVNWQPDEAWKACISLEQQAVISSGEFIKAS